MRGTMGRLWLAQGTLIFRHRTGVPRPTAASIQVCMYVDE